MTKYLLMALASLVHIVNFPKHPTFDKATGTGRIETAGSSKGVEA